MNSSNDPVILVIDTDPLARQALWDALSILKCRLLEASTAAKGLMLVRSFKPTLVLTDIDLPDMDGLDFIQQIRADKESSVVVVSAKSHEQFVIDALDAGAEDFIPKPFSKGELGARVRTALRHASRNSKAPHTTFRAGELEIDSRQRRVRVSGKDVHLTPLEYQILSMLIDNAGRVLTYDRILQAWTTKQNHHLQDVRALMWRLRRKLESDPTKPRFLINASGLGYQFLLGER
jgi:two-component system KDP operon response regulator KdpE